MFGNNNKKEVSKSKSGSIIPTSGTNSLNSLVQGTTVEGTVTSDSDIRVDGMIKGKLICKAKVIIGNSGTIEGEVKCRSAVIEGTFNGSIVVDELLNIRESAKISGEIATNKLIVQSGAVFNVSCNMGGKKNIGKNTTQPSLKTVKQDTDKVAGEPKPARVK
jgi:cytoskeletal protein CcmA (bactofilin family)